MIKKLDYYSFAKILQNGIIDVVSDGTVDERLQPYAQNPSHALQSK